MAKPEMVKANMEISKALKQVLDLLSVSNRLTAMQIALDKETKRLAAEHAATIEKLKKL